jgi:hypothetical protein
VFLSGEGDEVDDMNEFVEDIEGARVRGRVVPDGGDRDSEEETSCLIISVTFDLTFASLVPICEAPPPSCGSVDVWADKTEGDTGRRIETIEVALCKDMLP